MPEGDTIYRLAGALHSALAEAVLTGTDFRIPHLAATDLTGRRMHEVSSYGKHLLMRLAATEDHRALTLHSHLMMDGAWHLYRPGERWRKAGHTARAVLHTVNCSAVAFDVQQLRLLPTADEAELLGHLGPDLLGPNWDPALAEANLRAEPQRMLGTALLDQRLLAGIGNIYRAEVLFLTRLHPATPIERVDQLPRVLSLAHRLLTLNKDRARRVTTGDPRSREPLWVHGRAGKPCLRCAAKVEVMPLGDTAQQPDRDCYYCPQCQRMKE